MQSPLETKWGSLRADEIKELFLVFSELRKSKGLTRREAFDRIHKLTGVYFGNERTDGTNFSSGLLGQAKCRAVYMWVANEDRSFLEALDSNIQNCRKSLRENTGTGGSSWFSFVEAHGVFGDVELFLEINDNEEAQGIVRIAENEPVERRVLSLGELFRLKVANLSGDYGIAISEYQGAFYPIPFSKSRMIFPVPSKEIIFPAQQAAGNSKFLEERIDEGLHKFYFVTTASEKLLEFSYNVEPGKYILLERLDNLIQQISEDDTGSLYIKRINIFFQ